MLLCGAPCLKRFIERTKANRKKKKEKKNARRLSVLSLTENTQRYKSLAGFAIFPCGSDIRLRLAICPAGREGIYIISHWSEATIYRTSKASISRLLANISSNRKREDVSAMKTDLFSLCRRYRGLGLAHLHLTSQMRCSHLAEFSNSPLRTSRFMRVILNGEHAAI